MKTIEKIQDLLEVGTESIKAPKKLSNTYLKSYRNDLIRCAGLTALAAGFGFLAFGALKHATKAAHEYKTWKEADKKLDSALVDTFDASDPIAKY